MSTTVDKRIEEIRNDRDHGAGWLSREALVAMRDAAENSQARGTDDFLNGLKVIARRLIETRPSMAPIRNLVGRFIFDVLNESQSEYNLEAIRVFAMALSDRLIRESLEATADAARLASEVITDNDMILSCSYSSTVCQAFAMARDSGKHFKVVVAESRTVEGRAYGETTTSELKLIGVDAQVIPDDSISLHTPEVNKVLVGADSVLSDGSLINGVPSHALAAAAYASNIPFYSVCETSKLNHWSRCPHKVQLEEGFDMIPANLITGIITELELVMPDNIAAYKYHHGIVDF